MSLTKLLKAPIKLFKKEVITFFTIRRYDLGIVDERLRYIAVKPSASIAVLRQKVWYLLNLPDYCEEVIILKSDADVVIPLSVLRKGNDPQHPYILEVWLPGKANRPSPSMGHGNMLEIGNGEAKPQIQKQITATDTLYEGNEQNQCSQSSVSGAEPALQKLNIPDTKTKPPNFHHNFLSELKRSEMSVHISSTSLFKISNRKSKDNVNNVLLRIQSDLCTLSNKLSALENRIQS